ncbi:IucA/IucC family protein [Haloarcula mannanilytica]|uniref:IucA/IucC family protein n=1 Tax=Haloarcula mannanilytica TaxID=2509225 RepID=UPI00190F8E0B|nr:IucA/IucC family protein [Haloarcula mannanilytica]
MPGQYKLGDGEFRPLTLPACLSLLLEELGQLRDEEDNRTAVLRRSLESYRNIERSLEARDGGLPDHVGEWSFHEAEQSLLFGHQMHPSPKSRVGFSPGQADAYVPELGGSVSLAYFRAKPRLVWSDSAVERSAPDLVRDLLRQDPTVSEEFVAEHVESEDVLLPVHPWQAARLRESPRVQRLLDTGTLRDLGLVGQEFYPTTSVRTLYHPAAEFMVKCSLAVAITNSVRTNKRDELVRGIAAVDLFRGELGEELTERYPSFSLVGDPAFLTVDTNEGDESGFEVLLRENPFRGGASGVAPIVALCQDVSDGNGTQLGRHVSAIAEATGRPVRAVAKEWFRRYLDVVVEPVAWLYLQHGLAIEAHQQNVVLGLDAGFPDHYYHRDNQGYYATESKAEQIISYAPKFRDRFGTVYPDTVADERLRYQLFVNNVFGVVDALGTGGVADEADLLAALRDRLRDLQRIEDDHSEFVSALITKPRIARKGNLLTRFRDFDESADRLNRQAVYTPVTNPLVAEASHD